MILYDTTTEADVNLNALLWRQLLSPAFPDAGVIARARLTHVAPGGDLTVQLLGPGSRALERLMDSVGSYIGVRPLFRPFWAAFLFRDCSKRSLSEGVLWGVRGGEVMGVCAGRPTCGIAEQVEAVRPPADGIRDLLSRRPPLRAILRAAAGEFPHSLWGCRRSL